MSQIRTVPAGLAIALCLFTAPSWAAPKGFQEAMVTEAVNQVDVVSGTAQRPARVNQVIRGTEIIRTGQRSRAELRFPDNTIARVGANAAFAFRTDTRGFELQKGSILFHSPKGLGGGQIRTAAATASVLGTTIIVCATPNGGFKVLVLEGKAKVQTPGGRTLVLGAGQMNFILPGGSQSAALTFRLNQQVGSSGLVNGFGSLLASLEKIQQAIERQENLISKGGATPTDLMIGNLNENQLLELLVDDPNSKPQNTIPSDLPPETLEALEALQAAFNRYVEMLQTPGYVDDGPLDPGHVIQPNELDDPINFLAFSLALDFLGVEQYPLSGEGPGFTLIQTPDFAFAPLCAGFVAHSLDFDNAVIDLSDFGACGIFTFLSMTDIYINGMLEVGGFEGIVDFHALGEIFFPVEGYIDSLNPGISMVFASAGPISIDTMSFNLPGGFLGLASEQDITLNSVGVTADQGVRIKANGAIDISDFTLYASYGGGYGDYVIVNGPPENGYTMPYADIFAGGPISLYNVDFGMANVVALTPDTLSIGGTFYANGIDAIAGNMDFDISILGDYYPMLEHVRLTQVADWAIGPTSLYAYDEIALGSFGNLSLDQTYLNAYGGITLSGQDVTLDNYSSLMTSYTDGGKGITLDAAGTLEILGSYVSSAHHLDLLGTQITVDGSTLTVNATDPMHLLRVDALDAFMANATTFSSSGPMDIIAKNRIDLTGGSITVASPHTVSLYAGDRINVNGTAFNAGNIRLQAITIALQNVNFPNGSMVTLRSGNGMLAPNPNQNQPVMPGYVNYIQNVRYDSQLLGIEIPAMHANISIQKINP